VIAAAKAPVILMAEDDSDDRLLAREALEESGLHSELRFVENGADMMDYLRQRNRFEAPGSAPRPSLILLDLNMPRKDGREVLKEIKADPVLCQIPVVVLTTSRADTDIASIYQLGANSFICKPTAFDALVKVMSTLGQYWFGVVVLPVTA
jgi:CheY-like chemotaxis protein